MGNAKLYSFFEKQHGSLLHEDISTYDTGIIRYIITVIGVEEKSHLCLHKDLCNFGNSTLFVTAPNWEEAKYP